MADEYDAQTLKNLHAAKIWGFVKLACVLGCECSN